MKHIFHIRNSTAVRCPGVDVDTALAAEKIQQFFLILSVIIHHSKRYIHVRQMLIRFQLTFSEGQVNDVFSIRRNEAEPVVGIGIGHLGETAAVTVHPPYLHQTASGAVEPDVLSVR